MRKHRRVENQIATPVTVHVGDLHVIQQVDDEVTRVMTVLGRWVIPLRKTLGGSDRVKSEIANSPE
jgi:hypothetical protein